MDGRMMIVLLLLLLLVLLLPQAHPLSFSTRH